MKIIAALLFGILIGLLPVIENPEHVFSFMEASLIGIAVCAAILVFTSRWRGKVEITLSDFLALVYLSYGVLNIALVLHFRVDSYTWWKWGALALGYIVMRTVKKREWVLAALVLAGVGQAMVAMAQKAGLVESNSLVFAVTGTFRNPGPLGGFLAVGMTIALGMFFNCCGRASKEYLPAIRRRLYFWLCLSASLVIAAGLFLADSRASWLAVPAGALVCFWPRIREYVRRRKLFSTMIAATILIVVMAVLFQYRAGSANARLLIWRVCADMIGQKPMLGHGIASFNEKYMLYQGAYFASHPDSRFLMSADNVFYPYNELLHIFIEQGITGVVIVIALFYAVFSFRSRNNTDRILKGALSGLVVFSCFSYPAAVFSLLFLFAVLLGGLQSRRCLHINIKAWVPLMLKPVFVAVSVLALCELPYCRQCSKMMERLFVPNDEAAQKFVADHYNRLRYSDVFNHACSEWLRSSTAQTCPKYIEGMFPYCEGYCTKGDYFLRNGEYALAEKYYKIASDMVPTRLLPNYRLWQLYMHRNDTTAAHRIRLKAISQPLKLNNEFTRHVQEEIDRFLKETSKNPKLCVMLLR